MTRRVALGLLTVLATVAGSAGRTEAAARFALVVAGASGSPQHATVLAQRRDALAGALVGPLGVPPDHVVVLGDGPPSAPSSATREHVQRAVQDLAARMAAADTLLVVLIGHGTDDGVDAKFNLVGPDLEAEEWRRLLQPVPGRLVFVNTSSASAAFLARIAGPGRVVITATDTPVQKYDTVFADYFAGAFTAPDADLDKDARVSIGEAFAFASARVKKYYADRGQLATERAVLDDTGDGKGKEAGAPGDDGALASRTFLDAGPEATASTDPAVSELLARRDALEATLEELRRKKEFMPADDYERELERVLVEHARVSRRIRSRS